jgi:hypothetical protein
MLYRATRRADALGFQSRRKHRRCANYSGISASWAGGSAWPAKMRKNCRNGCGREIPPQIYLVHGRYEIFGGDQNQAVGVRWRGNSEFSSAGQNPKILGLRRARSECRQNKSNMLSESMVGRGDAKRSLILSIAKASDVIYEHQKCSICLADGRRHAILQAM